MRLMAFTDEQLAQIRDAAQPIPRAHRAAYLERVTALLAGRQFGNRDVQRSGRIGAARANRSSGYGMTRADDSSPVRSRVGQHRTGCLRYLPTGRSSIGNTAMPSGSGPKSNPNVLLTPAIRSVQTISC